jgi:membrane associated rhomboid family serine protease
MPEKSEHEKSLMKVMVFGTALSFAILGAIIGSMKGFFHGDATFTFSVKTIIGFVIGFVAGWLFWKVVRNKMAKRQG